MRLKRLFKRLWREEVRRHSRTGTIEDLIRREGREPGRTWIPPRSTGKERARADAPGPTGEETRKEPMRRPQVSLAQVHPAQKEVKPSDQRHAVDSDDEGQGADRAGARGDA